MVCKSNRLVTGNSGLGSYSGLANTECHLNLLSCYSLSFRLKVGGVFGLRVSGSYLLRAWEVCLGVWFFGFFCLVVWWFFGFVCIWEVPLEIAMMFLNTCLVASLSTFRRGTQGEDKETRQVVGLLGQWDCPLLFLKVSWPRREELILTTEHLAHWNAILLFCCVHWPLFFSLIYLKLCTTH